MADERVEGREVTWRQLFPWTELFRGFRVAMDLNKLLLAAAGIVVMAFGWWLLSVVFGAGYKSVAPNWPGDFLANNGGNSTAAWARFKQDRENWNLMNEAANVAMDPKPTEVEDVAVLLDANLAEFEMVKDLDEKSQAEPGKVSFASELDQRVAEKKLSAENARAYKERLGRIKRAGTLATWPWFEDRGPNPFLLVTGQAGIPWEPGHFWEWFSRDQLLVMIEPLVKVVRPIVYFFRPRATGYLRFYFLAVLLWTLATWSVFGGAITRIAAVQVARGGEKIGMTEALRFTFRRILSYLLAPMFPLVFVFVLLVFMIIFGWVGMIPVLGDIFVSGLFWPVMLIFGLVMAIALVGLVGWPLMAATISTEGTDSWEAVSRSYSYVYQRPWHYIWYTVVAIAYGAVVVFFVGFMGSMLVYLSKWGVAQTPWIQAADREPSYLFVYAPTSYGWRDLMLEGTRVDGDNVVSERPINSSRSRDSSGGFNRWSRINRVTYEKYIGTMSWWNKIGAGLVTFWLGLLFLLILGFGYSYFWSAGTIIYLLMRRHIDSADLDEVYLEEDEPEGPIGSPMPAAVSPTPVKTGAPITMVETPTLRSPTPASSPLSTTPPVEKAPSIDTVSSPAPPAEPLIKPPPSGDGNPTIP